MDQATLELDMFSQDGAMIPAGAAREPVPFKTVSVPTLATTFSCQCQAVSRDQCAAKKFGIYGGRCIGVDRPVVVEEPSRTTSV